MGQDVIIIVYWIPYLFLYEENLNGDSTLFPSYL